MKRKLTKEEYIAKNKFTKKTVVREYDSSELKLEGRYDSDLNCILDAMICFCNKAKKVLSGKSNIKFYQNWTSYEECEIELDYDDLETDEEFDSRIDIMYGVYLKNYDMEEEESKNREYQKKLKELNNWYRGINDD